MKTSHTPAPWTFQNFDDALNDGRDFITIEHEGCPLCEVRGTDDMSCIEEEDEPVIAAEMLANAKLIAAAPDLLEALKIALANPQKVTEAAGAYSIAKKFPVTPELKAKADWYDRHFLSAIKKATE